MILEGKSDAALTRKKKKRNGNFPVTQEFKKSSDTNSELRQFPTYQESEVGISDAQLRHHQLLDELGAGGDGGADGEQEHGRLDRQRRQRRRQRQKRFQEKALHCGPGIKVFRR